MTDLLDYDLTDGIATITLDDGKANAMSLKMLQALNAALDRAEADNAIVVLGGRAGMFCGGFDLAVFKRAAQEQLEMLQAGARMTARLLAFPAPVVVACSGHAIAMGVFLVLCGDVRVGVDQGATIQVNEVQIGLTLPRFAIEVCRQRLAPAHFNLATLTARRYSGEQAVAAGFLDLVVEPALLAHNAREQAVGLQKLHRDSFTATKLRLRQPTLVALQTGIDQDIAGWAARIG